MVIVPLSTEATMMVDLLTTGGSWDWHDLEEQALTPINITSTKRNGHCRRARRVRFVFMIISILLSSVLLELNDAAWWTMSVKKLRSATFKIASAYAFGSAARSSVSCRRGI